MNLSKENMKKIILLMTFAALLVLIAFKMEVVITALGVFIDILNPFILGGAIAFVINVPMTSIENKFFPKEL